jgi:transposase-like protein
MAEKQPNTAGMSIVGERLGVPVDEYLRDAYLVRELPQTAIAAELGVDAATVSRWMRRFGIRTRIVGHRKTRAAA